MSNTDPPSPEERADERHADFEPVNGSAIEFDDGDASGYVRFRGWVQRGSASNRAKTEVEVCHADPETAWNEYLRARRGAMAELDARLQEGEY